MLKTDFGDKGEHRLVLVFFDAYVGNLWQVIASQVAQRKCEENLRNCQWNPVRCNVGYWFQARFLVRNMPANYKGGWEHVADFCKLCALVCSLMTRKLCGCIPTILLACLLWPLLISSCLWEEITATREVFSECCWNWGTVDDSAVCCVRTYSQFSSDSK